ncbi:CYFA0S01e07030g1_1 [Cyberlindnera fabianii]|uniref:CYFA0S01e07030g1_1 n=1 Tax=Cyberlindnera fabianii TaxID=36022 RepID=A0A061AQS2_CYBFA|nr:Protein SGT1 [Cyberlindnera fabianii]CDR37071.1 CYFA0S01e07030g1_1 [Cyberlindnera fabianii]
MTIASDLEKAQKLCDDRKITEAIDLYNKVISSEPKSYKAYLGKSIAEQRNKNYTVATACAQKALEIALRRGKKELIDEVVYRLFTIMNNAGDIQSAVKYLNFSKHRGHNAAECDVWMHQLKNKATNKGLEVDFEATYTSVEDLPQHDTKEADVGVVPSDLKKDDQTKPKIDSLSIEDNEPKKRQETVIPTQSDIDEEKKELEKKMANHDNLYPAPKDIRIDWFQQPGTITVSMFVKNLPKDDRLKVVFSSDRIEVEFPTSSSSDFMYEIGPLAGKIDPSESTFRVFSTKLEMYLVKTTQGKWKTLERTADTIAEESINAPIKSTIDSSAEQAALKYPNSSKRGTDWSKLNLDSDEEESTPSGADAFFQNLYKDADEDTKRAMMKSYIESGGTALSTNWDEVATKKYDISPPDGMEVKKWEK